MAKGVCRNGMADPIREPTSDHVKSTPASEALVICRLGSLVKSAERAATDRAINSLYGAAAMAWSALQDDAFRAPLNK
jgi:hypothetical protein